MIKRDQKADWDETHPKGGTYSDGKPTHLNLKYEKDSYFLLGIATVPDITAPGGIVGRRLLPHVYIGRNVVSHAN
eukprot:11354351-Ditylum_brightwellii.AAC.1